MEDDVILKVENLSKQYRLGLVGTGTISHDLNRFLARIRGKEDPYLKIGESNDRSTKGTSEYVWALKDINFEVKRGEVLGIIGKNGAGKSTLLKILSKVTGPTTGAIKSKGRIASLLEVGTGFHPEMTGKENIFLNGAILGMTKKEITSKLDEIIEFSGCERYIDTPVKRYSSGMKVRLAFAVAAFLEPDILVVDEVLAVGDAEFQKKAIGKMQDISSQGGRTVLFVSHDMVAVQSLCSRLIVLENGGISFDGSVVEGVNYYMNSSLESDVNLSEIYFEISKNRQVSFIKLKDSTSVATSNFFMGKSIHFQIGVKNNKESKDVRLALIIYSSKGEKIAVVGSMESSKKIFDVNSNDFSFNLEIMKLNLMPGRYFITTLLAFESKIIDKREECISFKVIESDVFETGKIPIGNYIVYFNSDWNLLNI
jgi:lipopolysaccharide transport system ATP-binding protein